MSEKHPGDPRKFRLRGGPFDGVKVRHYPEHAISERGHEYWWDDITLDGGRYPLPHPLPPKMPTLHWEEE